MCHKSCICDNFLGKIFKNLSYLGQIAHFYHAEMVLLALAYSFLCFSKGDSVQIIP